MLKNSESPNFTVKTSQRARNVRLSITPHKGLELIVPVKFNLQEIPNILHQHRTWIEKNLLKIENINIENNLTTDKNKIPTEIKLTALNQTWQLELVPTKNKKIKLFEKPEKNTIFLFGNTDNQILIKNTLIHWIKSKAHDYLQNLLDQLSKKTNLTYQKFTLRGQTTRWGSCSTKKSISLNYKLIFLPKNLVEHIILHELTHTVHFNHSTKFWKLLAKFDPDWKNHSHTARKLAQQKWVPKWV